MSNKVYIKVAGLHKLKLLKTGFLWVVVPGTLEAERRATNVVDSRMQCKIQYNKPWGYKNKSENGIQQKESFYITFYPIGDFILIYIIRMVFIKWAYIYKIISWFTFYPTISFMYSIHKVLYQE